MKTKINLLVDILILVFFALTGYSVLVKGMKDVHEFAGEVLFALIIIHMILHWKCLMAMIKNIIK